MIPTEKTQNKNPDMKESSYSEEPKLVVRVLPSQMRFIKRLQDDMGMNRSDAVRFLINLVRFEHQTTRYVHSVMERHAWVSACERRLGMTDKEVISWCVDFVRYLDDNGLLNTLLDEVFKEEGGDEKKDGDAEQAVKVRSIRVKKILAEEEKE